MDAKRGPDHRQDSVGNKLKPHPALSEKLLARLRREADGDASGSSLPIEAPAPPFEGTGVKAVIKRFIRKATAWYVEPTAQRAASEWASRVHELLSDDIAGLSEAKRSLEQINTASINMELMKAEFRSLLERVEQLGMAIAPGAGLEAAPERIAELRERLNALERRTRGITSERAANPTAEATPPTEPSSASVDYAGLERRFRGPSEAITEIQKERYLELLTSHPPVLDIGCGKGELLELLQGGGVEALGIDLDPGMVQEARSKGLDVHEGDALSFLSTRPEASLGSIVSLHVVEHLPLDSLVRLLELSVTRLKPGGVFVAETPNPASLIVLGNSFVLDPTHVNPIHPSLMTFLCESAGFRDVRLEFYSPAADYHLPRLDTTSGEPWLKEIDRAFESLNRVLFGPQEYAVIATSASS